jgi:hypothetical protein
VAPLMTLLFVAHLLHQSAKFIDASHGRPMILISVSSIEYRVPAVSPVSGIGTLAVALALIPDPGLVLRLLYY